jgi:hypothetical protein
MTPREFTKAVQPRVIANKNFEKLFCIGYNKTGTTTLETILRIYGYNMPNQQQQEIRLSKSTFATNYSELTSFCANYDAFQDMPFSQGLTYVAADAIFPNSKFILSERPADAWYKSMCKFHEKILNIDDVSKLTEKDVIEKFTYLYPGYSYSKKRRLLSSFEYNSSKVHWEKLYDRDWYIDMYQRRNEEIKRYFMNIPEKLLVIDVTQEKTTRKICEFLNIPIECVIGMPHSNKT